MEETDKTRKTFAFVIAGVMEEWPEALKHRLQVYLDKVRIHSLELKSWNTALWEQNLWDNLLAPFSIKGLNAEESKEQLQIQLSSSTTPLFFCFLLDGDASKNLDFIRFVVQSWESLELADSSRQHVLLIVYALKKKGKGFCSLIKSIFKRSGDQKVEQWRQEMAKKLGEFPAAKNQNPKVVVPKLDSPKEDDITHWRNKLLTDEEQALWDKAFLLDAELKRIKDSDIPHLTLKNIYQKVIPKTKEKS